MKKNIILLVLLVLTLGSTKANPVSPATARQVATTWMQAMGMGNVKTLVDVTAQTPFTEFYLFAAPDSGFIIVSGDDCAVPVIGYSVENSFSTKDIPQHVLSFLTAYEEEIRWSKLHPNDILDTVARQWQMLTNGQMPKAVFDHGVMPMMVTRWSQRPYYNDLCPVYDDTIRCMAGCVAVSVVQVMKYWNFPERGYGSHSYEHNTLGTIGADFGATTYDWAHMPYRLTAASSAEEVEAVAQLMYHCGVALEMNYGPDASSAFFDINSLAIHFKYRPYIHYIMRDNYTHVDYCNILRNELDHGRPMFVTGSRIIGGIHAFNCDGYSTHNYFHFNMGWGDNGNGYYTVSCIMSGSDRIPYFVNTTAYIGIEPNYDWDTNATTTVTASVVGATGAISGTGTYNFGDTVVLLVDSVPAGYRFVSWNDMCSENPRTFIATGGTYNFTALIEPLTGDTLSYCGNNCDDITRYSIGDTTRWGILLPKTLFGVSDTLTAVQIFTVDSGDYFLDIYHDSIGSNQPLYSTSCHFDNDGWFEYQWHTIPLSTPIIVDSLHDLIIYFEYFENRDGCYPAVSLGHYGGTPYSSLYGENLKYYSDEITWMIRAILGTHSHDTVDNFCSVPFYVPYYLGDDSALFCEYAPCWTTLDADGDGYGWDRGNFTFSSNSWRDGEILTPDNWLFSPAIELPDIPCTLSWLTKFNRYYPNEHYNIYISTTGTDTADFTLLAEYVGDTTGQWLWHSLPLDDWSGNTIHLAFRHFNSTDQNYMNLTSIQIVDNRDKTLDLYPNNPAWGSVTGSGSYPYGCQITVEAIPFEGYTFQNWSNGVSDNPYTLTLVSDTVLTALFFNTTGIEDADYEGITIYVRDGHIVVEGAEGEEVQLYDMEGRLLWSSISTGELNTKHLTLNTGTYLVRVGNRAAQKVIVIQ